MILRGLFFKSALLLGFGFYANAGESKDAHFQNQPAVGSSSDQIAKDRFEFDRSNEIEKNRIESLKLMVTGGSILIGFVGTILTIGIGVYSIRSQIKNAAEIARNQSDAAFAVKTAEIIMNSRNAFATHSRAKMLQAIFPDQIPEKFAESFDPKEFRGGIAIDLKLELLKLIVANPSKEEQIIETFHKLFPDTKEDKIFQDWKRNV